MKVKILSPSVFQSVRRCHSKYASGLQVVGLQKT